MSENEKALVKAAAKYIAEDLVIGALEDLVEDAESPVEMIVLTMIRSSQPALEKSIRKRLRDLL